MVALDDDWSAVRLKAAAHIKTLTRRRETCDSALGKRKATATAKAMKAMKLTCCFFGTCFYFDVIFASFSPCEW